MKIRIIIAFLLAFQFACTTREGLRVHLKQGDNSLNHLLSVSYRGDAMQWQADTIAVVSWWDKQGDEHTQAVSEINGWSLEQQPIEKGYSLKCNHEQSGFSFNIELVTNDSILFTSIPSSGIKETGDARLKSIRLLPHFGAAVEGETGYLVTSKGIGTLCYLKDKEPREYWEKMYGYSEFTMPLFGIIRGQGGYAGIVANGQFDTKFCIRTNWGPKHLYAIYPEFTLRSFAEEQRLSDDIEVQYHFLRPGEASWLGIAKHYRQYNLAHRNIRTLKERIANSPELAYSSGSMEVRLRLGVKPVPYKIKDQTPETEPPVRVFLTFKQVRDVFDQFQAQGIKEAEFCLVGWNIGGHDGRYPQILPVEPSLGGERELRKTIAYGQSLGYQVVAHNNHYDAFKISEDWDESYIRKKANGELYQGGQWGGGQSYNICLSRAYELFAKRDLSEIRKLGFQGVHYIDVLTCLPPRNCYDPHHPETKRQDAEATNRILLLAKELFGGVQSEGGLDFAAPVLDRAYCIDSGSGYMLESPWADECVPLYPAVYHGVILYNLTQKTINSLPGDFEYLQNIEYGGLPLIYFYKFFILEKKSKYSCERDYFYENKVGLENTVSGFKKVYDDVQVLKHLQMEYIEGHNKLAAGVFETLYSNGERVVVNYNDAPFQMATGEEIPPKGFKLVKKNN